MFIKSTLIALALALTVSTTPLLWDVGTPIVLDKRIGLSASSGFLDHAKTARQVVSDRNIADGPPAVVTALYKTIPGSSVYDPWHGLYQFPCTAVPANFGSSWGGRMWMVLPDNLILGRMDSDMAVAGVDLGLGNGVWLLGDSFMKNVYSVFSKLDKKAVGFAQLK